MTALGQYDGILKQAIAALKYSDRPDVAAPLGRALAQQWQLENGLNTNLRNCTYVVPIPLHIERQRQRGYNQAERIADAFCKVSRLPLVANALQRVKATQPQHALNAQARQQNLAQVFQVSTKLQQTLTNRRKPLGKPAVLLVDDIYTTGATVQSAADTLQRAGFPVVGVAVVAQAVMT